LKVDSPEKTKLIINILQRDKREEGKRRREESGGRVKEKT